MTTTKPSTPLQVIDRMIELLGEGEWRWTQGALARREDGTKCETADDPAAYCFCLAGAFWRASGAALPPDVSTALNESSQEAVGLSGYITFNDTPSTIYADVMALLRRAREIIVEEEG